MATQTMTIESGILQVKQPAPVRGGHSSSLIAQPERPKLPIRVPVIADCGGSSLQADVIGSTTNVLLLQQTEAGIGLPPLGTPIRLRVEWDGQLLLGRMAAHGVAGRFLVSIGERAIRYSRRFPVDLAGLASSAHLYGSVEVRIVDLSTGGARVKGIDLPVGTEIELQFTPPGQSASINVQGFIVRAIDGAEVPMLGVAFRLVQASMDLLGKASQPSA